MSMGRFFDFAKRRIVGYIVFWILVLLFLGVFYQGNAPAQAGGLFILGLAFIGSLLYTRRMKRRQRARREAENGRNKCNRRTRCNRWPGCNPRQRDRRSKPRGCNHPHGQAAVSDPNPDPPRGTGTEASLPPASGGALSPS